MATSTTTVYVHINTIVTHRPGLSPSWSSSGFCSADFINQKLRWTVKFNSVKAKATNSDQNTKKNSVICGDCDGNGAVLCSQCKGDGVNIIDHFNGQFKVGESCWLCGGKKDMLCGNCNGAGFIGGFMNSFDT